MIFSFDVFSREFGLFLNELSKDQALNMAPETREQLVKAIKAYERYEANAEVFNSRGGWIGIPDDGD